MKKLLKVALYALCMVPMFTSIAKDEDPDAIEEGNIALPTSQQPSILFGFGQTIIGKGSINGYALFERTKGRQSTQENVVIPYAVFGISDTISLSVALPVNAKLQECHECSSGVGDLGAEIEYAFYTNNQDTYGNLASIIGSIDLPTGSAKKTPATGGGSPSFFVGVTASHLSINWLAFAAAGAYIPTKYCGVHTGKDFLYQCGFGHNFYAIPKKLIIAGVLEFNGTFTQPDRRRGINESDTGGNIFEIAPSFWLSTKHLIFQAGVSIPVAQHLFGNQPKRSYSMAINIGWNFK